MALVEGRILETAASCLCTVSLAAFEPSLFCICFNDDVLHATSSHFHFDTSGQLVCRLVCLFVIVSSDWCVPFIV